MRRPVCADLLQAVTLLSSVQLQFFSQRKPTGPCPSLQVEVIPLAAVRLMPCSPQRLVVLYKSPTSAPAGPGDPLNTRIWTYQKSLDSKGSGLLNTHKDLDLRNKGLICVN